MDAVHLAFAEAAGVDVLLSVDRRLLRRAQRLPNVLAIRVENPETFARNVLKDDSPGFR
jgi:hypothetical protein